MMLLTSDEIQQLTARRTTRAQARALAAMGIPYRSRPDGSLVVSRQVVDVALGLHEVGHQKREGRPTLRFPVRSHAPA